MDKYIVDVNSSLLEVMNKINENCKGIVYVCNGTTLVGVITDGNVRRHILNGGTLNATAIEVANKTPKVIRYNDYSDYNLMMKAENINSIPVINDKNEIVSIKFLNDRSIYARSNLEIPVVIMAGGKGTRLKPLTDVLPKPLIPIGEKTITERIMDTFSVFGCKQFNMIINYKKDLIKAYFKDFSNVVLTEEFDFQGTAGGLKLIAKDYKTTFFMTNCDVIIDDDYSEILNFHKNKKAIITMVCALREYTMPYGAIELNEGGNICKISEKPTYSFMVNTGVYVIEPRFLEYIPDDEFIHITDVIEKCIAENEVVGMYPVSENAWLDMGELRELEKMKKFFEEKGDLY